jgi:putative transcriptional regulator
MNKVKTYKSEAFAAIHETVSGMYDAGVIDKKMMHQFDKDCLTPIHEFSATEIKALREREEVSQTVFALYYECEQRFCQPMGKRA